MCPLQWRELVRLPYHLDPAALCQPPSPATSPCLKQPWFDEHSPCIAFPPAPGSVSPLAHPNTRRLCSSHVTHPASPVQPLPRRQSAPISERDGSASALRAARCSPPLLLPPHARHASSPPSRHNPPLSSFNALLFPMAAHRRPKTATSVPCFNGATPPTGLPPAGKHFCRRDPHVPVPRRLRPMFVSLPLPCSALPPHRFCSSTLKTPNPFLTPIQMASTGEMLHRSTGKVIM